MTSSTLLTKQEIRDATLKVLEDGDSALWDAWADGEFPDNCDDGDSFEVSLSLLRVTSLVDYESTKNGDKFSPIVLLYKSLYEIKEF
jgi:hypothetical protein